MKKLCPCIIYPNQYTLQQLKRLGFSSTVIPLADLESLYNVYFKHNVYAIKECDWVACLRPPEPPQSANLILTGWDNQPVPFGGTAKYVCKRGMFFETDPEQLEVIYECQE